MTMKLAGSCAYGNEISGQLCIWQWN